MEKNKKNLLCLMLIGISVLIFVIVLIANGVSAGSRASILEEQAVEIANLKNQVETQRASVQAGSSSVVQQTTGIDLERKAKDRKSVV